MPTPLVSLDVAPGTVVLVGGGPGDPGLITVRGLAAIQAADVIVHDRLAPLACLEHARPEAEIVPVGKVPRGHQTPQGQINAILVDRARRGLSVVRLKGGDNFVFGRGSEEWQACAAAGIPVRVIPGVTSAVAVPALAGIPVTHRSLTQGCTIVSGHVPPGDPRSTLNWEALACANTTLVILMGVTYLTEIMSALTAAGMAGQTPAAVIENGATPQMRVVQATVDTLPGVARERHIRPPAIIMIGSVVGLDLDREDLSDAAHTS
ncbi:MAG: uroporphyrinogen-III C-methyltransferase [Austwickia sp.]|nr:uroporphyrinogen-III C-methyltransferase [Austwickia sp.]MBK8437869.1 uroporphyrinogen-III C-methyltransferase [Austwickia sp.]MBK9100170.1 uroporphyrinogen-III C-methyltransferase [Austwickia sp.]